MKRKRKSLSYVAYAYFLWFKKNSFFIKTLFLSQNTRGLPLNDDPIYFAPFFLRFVKNQELRMYEAEDKQQVEQLEDFVC